MCEDEDLILCQKGLRRFGVSSSLKEIRYGVSCFSSVLSVLTFIGGCPCQLYPGLLCPDRGFPLFVLALNHQKGYGQKYDGVGRESNERKE